jgi:hypothetical protein
MEIRKSLIGKGWHSNRKGGRGKHLVSPGRRAVMSLSNDAENRGFLEKRSFCSIPASPPSTASTRCVAIYEKNMFEQPSERKEEFITNWIKPNLRNEVGEIQRVLENFLKIEPSRENILKFAAILESAPLIELTDEQWENLENTDSFHKINEGDLLRVEGLVEEYNAELPEGRKRSSQNILNGFQNGSSMEAPTIVQNEEGTTHLISGNTRLMIARALGIRPKVIIAKFPTEA